MRLRGLVILACLTLGLSSLSSVANGQEPNERGLAILGELPQPLEESARSISIEAIDASARRMYARYESPQDGFMHMIEYDLEPDVPRGLRDHPLPNSAGGYHVFNGEFGSSIDATRSRLLRLGMRSEVGHVDVIDLDALEVSDHWSLPERLPGFVALGITYSRADDRVYLVGEFNSKTVNDITNIVGVVGRVPTVVALEAEDGDLAWARAIPECQKLVFSYQAGTLIARSGLEPALYLTCNPAETRASGLVQVEIEPEGTQADAARFPVQFFPVPGLYRGGNAELTGAARFDPSTDRVFLHSLSPSTPGAFVFDGRLDAWVGFLAADDDGPYGGLNVGNGHFYMGGPGAGDAFLDVIDGRATPVAQGETFHNVAPTDHIVADPSTSRIFVRQGVGQGSRYLVVDDRTAGIGAHHAIDYDALTADVLEGPNTNVFFSGGSAGFGAATVLVGGFENALVNTGAASLLTPITTSAQQSVAQATSLTFGNRGVTTAKVKNLDVGSFDVAAEAQALVMDGATSTDGENLRNGTGIPLESPYTKAHCGEPDAATDPVSLGDAHVVCEVESGSANASYEGGYAVEGDSLRVAVGSSSFDAELRRNEELGLVGRSVAVARDMEVTTPQGSLSIGEIRSTARTVAHGRTGTSSARWTRLISGVVLRDADGESLLGPTSCVTIVDGTQDAGQADQVGVADSCRQLAEQIQSSPLQTRVQLALPLPEVEATPRGAFAQVRETQADFLEGRTLNGDDQTVVPAATLTVFMDGSQASRLLTEVAALRSNSIYYITQFQSSRPGSGTDVGLGFDATDGVKPNIGTGVDGPAGPDDGVESFGADGRLIEELTTFLSNVNPDALAQSGGALPDSGLGADPGFGGDAATGDVSGAPLGTDGLASGPSFGVGEPPALSDGVGGGDVPPPEVATSAPGDDQPTHADGGQPPRMLESGFFSRGVGDAAAVGGIWLLFLGALATALRRTSLLQLLGSR